MTGPVLFSVPAIRTEGFMSLVTRTVTRNLLPSSHILLRQVGSPHAQNPTAAILPDLDEVALAAILKQPVEEVTARRFRPASEPGFVETAGVLVRADEIVFRRRRFGPAAVQASPHGRMLWSLKAVPCCTEHWQYLVDTCPCGVVQRWQAADRLDRCDACNGRLAATPADSVAPELRDGLGFILGLLNPDAAARERARQQLPAALSNWNGGMVFEMALALMPVTHEGVPPRRGHQPSAQELPRYAASLAQAGEIVRRWPEALLHALADRVGEHALSRPNARYGGTGHYLAGLTSTLLPVQVRDAIASTLEPISCAAGTNPLGQIGMREATFLTGQEERKLAAARRAGHLRTRICLRWNRLLPTLDRQEVEWLADFLEHRLSAAKLSDKLHLPQYAVEQLVHAELLSVVDHPYVSAHYDTPQFHASEFARFAKRILDTGAPLASLIDPVPLHRVARSIGGGLKPWGRIFSELLEGRVLYSSAGASIDRIMISRADAAAMRRLEADRQHRLCRGATLSQRDAAEVLNLPLRHVKHLPGGPTSGGAHAIPWRRVRHLARSRVTLAELSALTGLHSTPLEARLEREGHFRRDVFGWPRRSVLQTVATWGTSTRDEIRRRKIGEDHAEGHHPRTRRTP